MPASLRPARLACVAILVPGLAHASKAANTVATVSMGNYSTVTMEIFRTGAETCTVEYTIEATGFGMVDDEGDFTLINGLGGLYFPGAVDSVYADSFLDTGECTNPTGNQVRCGPDEREAPATGPFTAYFEGSAQFVNDIEDGRPRMLFTGLGYDAVWLSESAYDESGWFSETVHLNCPETCWLTWDLNDDGMVGIADYTTFLTIYGTTVTGTPNEHLDLDGDGDITIFELTDFLTNWGESC